MYSSLVISLFCLVHVFPPGLGVTIEPSVLVVLNQNEDVTLTCQPSQGMMVNDNYQIVFLQNEVVVQNSSDNTYNITYVDEMSVSDGGVYRCTINGMNSMSTVEVIFAPSITDNPVDAFATSNDRVELVCTAVGSPPPNITWYRLDDGLGMEPFDSVEEIEANNRDLPVFSDINSTNAIDFTTTSTLTIDPVQFMDFGDYICVAILEDELNDTALSTNFTLPLFADSNIVSITVSPLGSHTATPINQTGSRGNSSTFNCSAEGGPMNTFRWVKGIVITGGFDTSQLPLDVSMILGSLSYVQSNSTELNVTVGTDPMSAQMQGGEYTCFVINEAGFDNSTVTLYISPEIVQDPMDQYVQDGDTVTLTCVGDSYPPPEYQWERWNMTANSYQDIPGETSNTLVFTSIEHEDYGRYRCVVTAPIIDKYVISESALITVSPNNSVAVDPSPNTTVNNGGDVVFTCSADGGPNNMFAWVKTDNISDINTELAAENSTTSIDVDVFLGSISNVILFNDSMLSLSSVSGSMDGGSYTCLVINEAGVGRQETTLYVSPAITEQPMDTNAENGDRVVLTCIADSFPAPEYQWELLNETNMPFNAIDFATQSTLVFDPVEYNDAGTYRCIVTTPIINEEVISNEAVLTVSPNNSIVITPSATTVDNGSNVTFVCSAQGNEDNYYFTWLRTDDTDILTDALLEPPIDIDNLFTQLDSRIIVNGTELTIDSVSATRDGGSYSCLVFNVAGSDTGIGQLFVNPVIITPPSDVLAEQGDVVTLTCIADSFDPPQYEWQFMNRTTQQFETIEGETNTELSFSSIAHEEYGMYQCVVFSEVVAEDGVTLITVNITSEPALITVSPNDSISVNPQQTTVNRSTTVTFECSADGGPNNMFYWVMDDSQSVDTTDLPASLNNVVGMGETLTLNSVNGSSGGTYTCVAFNDAGFDTASVVLYVSPEILEDPMNTFAENDDIVTLTCVADSFPAPQYQWQLMNDANFEDIYSETNSTLVFSPVDFSNFGTYRCVVTVPVIDETIISQEAVLTISPLGSHTATPINQTGSRGNSSTFNCSAEGGPTNTFRWVMGSVMTGGFDTSQLPLNVSMILDSLSYVQSNSNELNVTVGTDPTSAQMQGGEYTCLVINEAGFDNSTVTLYISPQIVQDPMNQYVQDGDTVTLTCVGDSYPPPEYKWERWNMTANSYQDIPGETSNTLVFTSIEHEDYGRYRCVVTAPIIDEYVMSESALITVSPNNSVAVDPSPNTTVNNGGDVVFTCSANGGPNNMFAWVKTDNISDINTELAAENSTTPIDIDVFLGSISNVMLFNDSMLSLSSVSGSMDGGSYTCLVINEAGVGRQETTLYVSPAITEQPMDTNAENGSRVVLTCIADSFPAPEYQWELNETNMLNAIDFATQSTLVFDPVEYNDAGTYRCIVTTPIINEQVISNEATLTVSPNNSIVITPSAITVDNGSNVTFVCSAQGNQDNYYFTWLRTNDTDILTDSLLEPPIDIDNLFTQLDGRIIVNGTELNIDSVNATRDGGSYSCLVFNVAGSDTGIGQLFVNPVIITPPSDVLAEQGDVVTLTCVADSFDPPQYEWQFMNRTTEQFETIEGETNTELSFSSIAHEEYGMYQCVVFAEVVAEDGVTLITVNITSEPALITVSPEGSVMIDPPVNNSFNGSLVELTCNEEGGPDNSFNWIYLRTGDMVGNDSPYYNFTSTIMTGGEYQCTVSNGAGNDSDVATVNVGPIITEEPQSQNVSILIHNIILSCEAIGIPVPSIIWTHNDTTLNANGEMGYFENGINIGSVETLGTSRSVLTIDSALANHTGEYYCNATSPVDFYESVMSQIVLVLVQDVPERPVNLTATIVGSRNITLEWAEPHDNNAPILRYRVFYATPSFLGSMNIYVDTVDDTEMLLIEDLHPGEMYMFTVSAFNEEGESKRSIPFVVRTSEEEPVGFPQNLNATTINSTAIIVSWDELLVNETNGMVTEYNVTGVPDESFASVVNMVVDSSVMSVEFNQLEEFVVYRFTVSASTVIGYGLSSPEASTKTSEADPATAPATFTVNTTTFDSISLEWTPPIPSDINGIIRRYVIRYRITEQLGVAAADLPMEQLEENVIGNVTLSTTLTGLDDYTVYEIAIAAVTIGEGPVAMLSQRTAENAPEAPPVFITATTNSTTSITIRWGPPPLDMTNGIIDSYEIRYGRFNRATEDVDRDIEYLVIDITDVQFEDNTNMTLIITIGGLNESVLYGFQVRATTVADGPFTEFATNTTFQAPPSVAPSIPDDPVPIDGRRATSVLLTWNPIPADDANGNLTYNVSITVRGQTEDSRKRRETTTNSLSQCLEAAGIMPLFSVSVPGDQTSLTLSNIAPNISYSFTVTGVTDAGSGPTSDSSNFSTLEGVPTEPQSVTLRNESSTFLQLNWSPPICDNGLRLRYTATIAAQPGPDPVGKLGDTVSPITDIDADETTLDFRGLTPNSPYQVVICARTAAGCGDNVTMIQYTTEDAPLPVTEALLSNASVSDVVVSWLSPSNRNGSFNVSFSYTAAQVFMYEERILTDSRDMNLLGSDTRTTVTETITGVLPYARYEVTLQSFNRLFGSSLTRDSVVLSIVSQPIASSAVTDISAVATTASEILVQWNVPLYPNGPISYFNICSNATNCSNAQPDAISHVLGNLSTQTVYYITVQPVTIFEGAMLIGDISESVQVFIDTLTPNVTGPVDIEERTTGTIVVDLPSYTEFGGTVTFYGVIVADEDSCNTVTDFGAVYPNPQSLSNSDGASYYVAAGWDDNSRIPSRFTAGGEGRTTAIYFGQAVTFDNPRLKNFRRYCVVAFVHLESGAENTPIVRYVNLATAETRLGYSREALGFFMTVIIILIIVGVVAGVLLILYKRYNMNFYSLVQKKMDSEPPISLNGPKNGAGIVIMNKINRPMEDPDEPTFVDPSSSKEPTHVKDFPAHVASMHSNDDYLFSVEYPSVEPRHAPTTEATHHPDNAVKNRYANITAYDHSRVRLQEIPNVPGSDYINASYIDGYKAPNAYIASQGPVPHSVPDFWRMIWEQNTSTIVMLTNLEEKGRIKCSMYWPPANKRVQVHGLIRVQLQEELYLSDHTIRTLSLQKEKGDERIVKQFHYTAWPDFGVPEHPTPLLRFIRKVESGNPANAGPLIIHCSAGVGRTGTFLTVSNQIKRIKDVQTVDIFNYVQSMRYRRCFMVQTEAQYIFTHDALLEVIECGETEVSARELKDKYRKLSAFNDTEGLMNIEIEYERIQETIHTEPIRYAGTLQHNRQKNRFHNVIPFDKTRCRLSAVPGVDGSDYVNANFVEGYHKGKAFVATQGPLPDTSEDFWRMVWEYKSSTIVMLAKEKEGAKVMCHRYWPDETTGSEMHGPFEISLHSVREYPDYILREIKIVDTRDVEGSSQHIKQYHYTGWPTEGVPNSAIGLLDIREQVEKWQRNSGDKPIIVHCSGGCGRTGTYIATCLLIDRLKTEGVIDIFQTVRGLRLQRPGMVRSVEQYDFIYKSILEYLGSFDNYANFSL